MEEGGQIMFYIVVVSYNAGDRLKETLKSILAQSYEHVRVIVRDAASTDGSLTEVMPLIREAGNIRLVSEPDEGIYDAMNRAVRDIPAEQAEGTYVLFLNCGDLLMDAEVLVTARESLRCIRKALQSIPKEYRQSTIDCIVFGVPYADTAHYNTWRKWRQIFIYELAKNLHLI